MAAGPIGTEWAADSWADSAWQADSWGASPGGIISSVLGYLRRIGFQRRFPFL